MIKFKPMKGAVQRVEHGVTPPFANVITVPIVCTLHDQKITVDVYIGVGAFRSVHHPVPDHELSIIAEEIVRRLEDR